MKRKQKRIGRILNSTQRHSRAEVTEDAMAGMLVSINRKGKKYLGRIEKIETRHLGGLVAYIYWLDFMEKPFANMTEIFIDEEELEGGHIYIGEDSMGKKVRLPINPLFSHTLTAGITTSGKTHSLIVLAEELGPLDVPCLVIDPQGEFINLPILDKKKYIVVEDLRIEDLVNYMGLKKTVIYTLLGYTKRSKVSRVAEILEELMHAKERDYQQANEDHRLLKLPPILIIVDEADIFAPRRGGEKEALGPMVDLLERGAKLGLGAVVATQRISRVDIDVRSQCNSAIIFKLIDSGSIQAVHNIDFIPKEEIDRIKALEQGQAIIAGRLVKRAKRVRIRDIKSPRAKHRDFEKMLGILPLEDMESEPPFVSRLRNNKYGDVVDVNTGEVVRDSIDDLTEADKKAYEKAEGDGIVLRSHISPEEQKILNKLRKTNKKGDRLIG